MVWNQVTKKGYSFIDFVTIVACVFFQISVEPFDP